MWFGAWRLKLHTVCWAIFRACWTASQSIRFMSYQQIDEPKGPARGQWYCWLEAILLLAVTHQRTFALLHSIVTTDNVWWLSRARSLWIIYLDSCAGSSFESIIWFASRCLDFSVSQVRLNEWNKSTSVSIINFYLLLSIKNWWHAWLERIKAIGMLHFSLPRPVPNIDWKISSLLNTRDTELWTECRRGELI